MKAALWFVGCLVAMIAFSGCCGLDPDCMQRKLDDCEKSRAELLARLQELEGAQGNQQQRADDLQRELDAMTGKLDGCEQKNALLQKALDDQMANIGDLTSQLGQQVILPEKLNTALEELVAKDGSGLLSYDPEHGVVRFKSDLLFDRGKDTIQAQAADQVKAFADILNTPDAQDFDILIVGHTDDIPIEKPDTKAKHPTNWYLSAHRSIAVQNLLASSGLAQNRIAVVGMGEYNPIAPNAPGKKGNPLNRRVEIYIVPAGSLRITNN